MDTLINSGSSFVDVYITNWIQFKNDHPIIIILIAFKLELFKILKIMKAKIVCKI